MHVLPHRSGGTVSIDSFGKSPLWVTSGRKQPVRVMSAVGGRPDLIWGKAGIGPRMSAVRGKADANRQGHLSPVIATNGHSANANNVDLVSKSMTADQIAEAQRLARAWKPRQ